MTKILHQINAFVWGAPTLILILGTGIFLSFSTRFVQFSAFVPACKAFFGKLFKKNSREDGISSSQAMCTALAATVGTGNIAGVAGAISIGGPGAVFWMWICGFLGMAIKFGEATLAVRYRIKGDDGEYHGGPMYMIRHGLGKRFYWLAWLYSFFGVVAAFGVGNATQVNAVISSADQMLAGFGIAVTARGNLLMGLVIAILVVWMLLGGARRIGSAAERLVPFASAVYLLLGLGVIILRWEAIPNAFQAILCGAFSPRGITGGMIGSWFAALRMGISRGVFTNEAGMGTASIAHASAKVSHPVEQGLMGIVEVFLDTIVICTITALVILCSGVEIPYGEDTAAALTTSAFCSVYGDWASMLIAMTLSCFAFATILGWGLYGARCAQFIFGGQVWKRFALLQGMIVVAGAVLKTGTIWALAEIFNGLMAIPNLIALGALSPELIRLTKQYMRRPGKGIAGGGYYADLNQCQSLRTLAHAEVPSAGAGGGEKRKEDLPPEHRSA